MSREKRAKKKAPSGPTVRDYLRSVGIDVQKVTQRRETGHYVAEFYYPKMETPVPSSSRLIEVLRSRVEGIVILDNHDTVADWREGKPVIWASVTFTLDG